MINPYCANSSINVLMMKIEFEVSMACDLALQETPINNTLKCAMTTPLLIDRPPVNNDQLRLPCDWVARTC